MFGIVIPVDVNVMFYPENVFSKIQLAALLLFVDDNRLHTNRLTGGSTYGANCKRTNTDEDTNLVKSRRLDQVRVFMSEV